MEYCVMMRHESDRWMESELERVGFLREIMRFWHILRASIIVGGVILVRFSS
jgi:hypothetical protein